jgi:hypothetical protein
MKMILAALALATPTGAMAQAPATATVETLDPARLDAAKGLLDVLMPPARRETMVDGMIAASTANMLRAMQSNPAFVTMFGSDARVKPIFERFLTKQRTELAATLHNGMPDMMAAMQRAYARRFTVPQMAEVRAFYATPTGQLYMEKGATIMSDPDVSAWQQNMMRSQMAKMPDATRALATEIMALPPQEKAK